MTSVGVHDRLLTTFCHGTPLSELSIREDLYGEEVHVRFGGYLVISKSFMIFLLDSLRRGEAGASGLVGDPRFRDYPGLLLMMVATVNRLRAAELLFLKGYPLDGYALLRDLKDRAIYLSAIMRGITTVQEVMGVPEGTANLPEDPWQALEFFKANRRKAQQRALREASGKESDLPESILSDLQIWNSLFDSEVHLSLQSMSLASFTWRELDSLPVGPQHVLDAAAQYMNRSNEVAWCLLRTLPILQSRSDGFGEDWAKKWRLLDESLRYVVQTLVDDGKQVVGSLIKWIDTKFNFDPTWSFPSREAGST